VCQVSGARPLRWGCVGPSRPVLLEGTRPWPAVAVLFLPDAPRRYPAVAGRIV